VAAAPGAASPIEQPFRHAHDEHAEHPAAPPGARADRQRGRPYADAVLDLTAFDLGEIATALADQNSYEHC
jgi:hypothetical protein